MGAWWGALPVVLVGTSLLTIPGLVCAWAVGLRREQVFGAAPVLSVSALAVADLISTATGISWSLLMVLFGTAVLAGAGVVANRLILRFVPRETSLVKAGNSPAGVWWFVGLAAAAGAVIAVATAVGMGAPDAINQTFDAPFHVNAIEAVVRSGSVSPSTVASVSAPGMPTGGFYPPVFHAVSALVVQLTGASAIVAANVVALVIAAVCWPLSMALFVRATLGRGRYVMAAAMLGASLIPLFPYLLLQFGVLWPNALSIAVLPAVVAFMVWTLSHTPYQYVGWAHALCCGGASALGLYYAHPGAVFAALGFGVPLVGAAAIRRLARLWKQSRRGQTRAVVFAASGVLAVVAFWELLGHVPQLASVRGFDWVASESMSQAFGEALALTSNLSPQVWALGALVIVGGVVLLSRRYARWLVAAHALWIWAFMLAAGSDGSLSQQVTGFWYNDRERLSALLPITAIPLLAVGASYLRTRLRRALSNFVGSMRWRPELTNRFTPAASARVSGLVILLVVVALLPGKAGIGQVAGTVAVSYRNGPGTLVRPQEEALYGHMAADLPLSASIVGNPWSGVVYAGVLSGHPMVYPHLITKLDPDRALVAARFKDYQDDHDVCAAVRRLNIGYAVEDTDLFWPTDPRVLKFPGLDGLSRVRGLHQIADSGTVHIYRVEPCR